MTNRREPSWTHMTKEEWVEAMKTRRRNVTDRHPGRRREQDYQQPDGHTLLDKYLTDHLREGRSE